MRYTGTLIKRVDKGGEHLIGRARTLLGILENRMRLGNLSQLIDHRPTSDGQWMIRFGNIRGMRFIQITGGEEGIAGGGITIRYYMDSGYLNVGNTNANPVIEFIVSPSVLYQSADLDSIYPIVDTHETYLPLNANVVRSDFPPSFNYDENLPEADQIASLWNKTSIHFTPGQLAGNNSGSLKLLAQAKLGLKLVHYSAPPINGYAASWSGFGLFNDEDGRYWRVHIVDGKTATFVLYAIPSVLREKLKDAESPKDRLIAEAWAFAFAQETDTVVSIGIDMFDEDLYEGSPWKGSWNFNWTGDKATLTVHRVTGSYSPIAEDPANWQMSLSSHVLVLSIQHSFSQSSGHTFTANITSSQNQSWMFHNYLDKFWVPHITHDRQILYCPVTVVDHPDALKTTALAANAPFYSYYGSSTPALLGGYQNDELLVYQWTRTISDPGASETFGCSGTNAAKWCSGAWQLLDWKQKNGQENAWAASLNGVSLASMSVRTVLNWQSKVDVFTFSITLQENQVFSFTTNFTFRDWSCGPGGCADRGNEVVSCTDVHPICPTNAMTVIVELTYGKRVYEGTTGSYVDSGSGVAYVFPLDCAEGMYVAENEGLFGANVQHWKAETQDNKSAEVAYGTYPDTYKCECGGGATYHATGWGGVTYPLGGGAQQLIFSVFEDVWIANGVVSFIGRNPTDIKTESITVLSTTGSPINQVPAMKWMTPSTGCQDHFVQIVQGVQDAMLNSGGLETQAENGYPANLAEVQRSGVLGLG